MFISPTLPHIGPRVWPVTLEKGIHRHTIIPRTFQSEFKTLFFAPFSILIDCAIALPPRTYGVNEMVSKLEYVYTAAFKRQCASKREESKKRKVLAFPLDLNQACFLSTELPSQA